MQTLENNLISTQASAALPVHDSAAPDHSPAPTNLSVAKNIKIGSFNIASAMADILGSGVWNRIMIADLHYPATPVSLLLALNYFLAPLAVWTGQKSDHTSWRGYRRLPWIWGGRSLMVIGFLTLALGTVELAETGQKLWWALIALALIGVGIGSSISGSTYTTLIYERAPHHQRGRAVGLAWTMLLMGFSIAGVLFARLLPHYSPEGLLALFTTAAVLMAVLWFFAVLGEEKPQIVPAEKARPPSHLWDDLQAVWSRRATRLFFLYIGLSFMGAFAQDQILEPFGGQMFDLSTGETSRFAAYWGSTALLGSIFALVIQHRLRQANYLRINRWGLATLALTFVLLTFTAYTENAPLLRPTLLLLGLGLGLWNIGTWGLMVSVSSPDKAGTYFGLWTMASLIFRGGGSVLGAIFRDVSIALTDSLAFSYGTVFAFEALIIVAAFWVLRRVPFDDLAPETPSSQEVIIALGADA